MSTSTETTEPVDSGDSSETQASLRSRVDLAVFIPAAAITLIFVIWGLTASESLTTVTGAILDFLVGDIGWVYVLAMCGVLACASSWCSAGTGVSGWARTTIGPSSERHPGSP